MDKRCSNCKFFKIDPERPESGECFYWKKIVSADYACEKFQPLKSEEEGVREEVEE